MEQQAATEGTDAFVLIQHGEPVFARFVEGLSRMARDAQDRPFAGALAGWVVKAATDPATRKYQYEQCLLWCQKMLGPRQTDGIRIAVPPLS